MTTRNQGKILYSLIAKSPTDILVECHAEGEPSDKSENGYQRIVPIVMRNIKYDAQDKRSINHQRFQVYFLKKIPLSELFFFLHSLSSK